MPRVPPPQEDLNRVADLHRKIGAGLWHKGERKQAIERYQKGINLLKDGPPCLELVRLYEEAASLYMHAGDNMLAIYASEKALRLAERMGETRAASRAHGIFGRVFGRIGDTAKARENLERSVELGRDSDQGETIRALLTLGHHLEVSEADYDGRRRGLLRGARAWRARSASCRRRSSCTRRSRSSRSTGPTGTRCATRPRRAPTSPSARASSASSASRTCCAALLSWRDGDWDAAEEACRRAHELADQVGWSEVAFEALYWLAIDAARPRRLRRRGHRARPRARRLRARRPDRAVDRGDVGAGGRARAGGQPRAGP